MHHKTDRLRDVKGEMLKRACCHFVHPSHQLIAVWNFAEYGSYAGPLERGSHGPFSKSGDKANVPILQASACQVVLRKYTQQFPKQGFSHWPAAHRALLLVPGVHCCIRGSKHFFDAIFLLSMSRINGHAWGEGSNIKYDLPFSLNQSIWGGTRRDTLEGPFTPRGRDDLGV
jgi:hypothetical protein